MVAAVTQRAYGKAEFAYLGEPAWHGLGSELLPDDDYETQIKKAGFDWEIERAPVTFRAGGVDRPVTDREVLYRSDSHEPLSIVSPVFKIVQPRDVMEYFHNLAERAGFVLETAGTLFGGSRFWALAKFGDDQAHYIADPKDLIKGRLLLSTGVDGTPTTAKFLAMRVVCWNTLSVGLREQGGTSVKVRHNALFSPDQVNKRLGIDLADSFEQITVQFRRMAHQEITPIDMQLATMELVRPRAFTLSSEDMAKLAGNNTVMAISDLAIGGTAIGSDLQGAAGTVWGWLNAVTQYVDHDTGSRTADTALDKAWFGSGNRLKERALVMARNYMTTSTWSSDATGADQSC